MEAIDMLEAGFVCHREDDEESIPCPHVLLPHCTELLLAGCVQHCGHRGTQIHIFKPMIPFVSYLLHEFPRPLSP